MIRRLVLAALALAFVELAACRPDPGRLPSSAAAAPAPYFTGGEFGYYAEADAKACAVKIKGRKCPLIVNGHQFYGLAKTYSLHLADGTVLTAPAGMSTDLASVPRLFWAWLPPDGPYGKAAGIHDDCYKTQGSFVWRWRVGPGQREAPPFIGLVGHAPLTRAQCDEALRQGMVALEVTGWKRVVIYEAVHLGGRRGWGH